MKMFGNGQEPFCQAGTINLDADRPFRSALIRFRSSGKGPAYSRGPVPKEFADISLFFPVPETRNSSFQA